MSTLKRYKGNPNNVLLESGDIPFDDDSCVRMPKTGACGSKEKPPVRRVQPHARLW